MDLNQWMSLTISLLLSGVGIFLAYKTNSFLIKMEERNKRLEDTITNHAKNLTDLIKLSLNHKVNSNPIDIDSEIEKLKKRFDENIQP